MPRKSRSVEGAVSDVSEVEVHPSGYRVRFRLNGTKTARYSHRRKPADELREQLLLKAAATKAGVPNGVSSLTASRLRQAETAYQLLDNAKLTHPSVEANDSVVVRAIALFIEAEKRSGKRIEAGEAYDAFMSKQKGRELPADTIRDYVRFLGPFVAARKTKRLSDILSTECKDFVDAQPSSVARFKCFTYLHAFFNFCRGHHNPHIDLSRDKPWIEAIPLNFEKPPCTPGVIGSYTTAEVIKILERARQHGGLGYVIFRLFSLARFDETKRFILKGGSDWEKNSFIDLNHLKIHFDSTVFRKRSKAKHRGRYIPIEPAFRQWINYLVRKRQDFGYVRWDDEFARRAVSEKFGHEKGYRNLLRHTAITMHVKMFKNPMETAEIAGTSPGVISTNYYNSSITEADAKAFYRLTPRKLRWS
jgi:hypothetical protein